ncbi:hypothetical protein KJ652_00005 [Patescibacteria group bacterium]|nr:hypothetical protein [Patescibacteria group bacterium]MBU1122955.1 hypothetical protein [Patescibacteria group bacterium]MBU1911339.1 hypothetical protein [Patescibacteria group bacterium]
MTEKVQILLMMIAVCFGAGGTLIAAAINDWNWIFESYKYRRWIKLFGRKPMRIIIGLVGLFICLIPAYLYFYKW